MAPNSMNKVLLSLTMFLSLQQLLIFSVSAFEFQVGDGKGWVVPPGNDSKMYSDWASEQRFKVGDTIRFKYKKDSVMEVNEEDYKKCNSSRPNYFSNTGNTVYSLDRSGYFYFISGATGHCKKGQRMIIKVLTQDQDSTAADHNNPKKSSSASQNALPLSPPFLALILASHSVVMFFA